MGNLTNMNASHRKCSLWVKSAICRESSFAKQKFIEAFCSVQQAVKCSKVNNGCDIPCASCTTLHLRGRNGLRWVIHACEMSSQTSWITRHNCTMVSGGGLRDLIWQSVRSFADRCGAGRRVRWPGQCMDGIWCNEVLCEADWEMKGIVPLPNGALQHATAFWGWGLHILVAHAVWKRLRLWRMVIADIRTLWPSVVSAAVLVDSLQWSHRCLGRICQSFDSAAAGGNPLREWFRVIPVSCSRCLNHRIAVCGTLKRLALPAFPKMFCGILSVISLSTMARPY